MKKRLYTLKVCIYNIFNTSIGKKVLRLLRPFVCVKGLKKKGSGKARHPFLVAVTIDAEAGYVQKNEFRVWQGKKPNAFTGFHKGLERLEAVLGKHKAKSTIFLSTQCFDASGAELQKIKSVLRRMARKHEIGLHLHPESDFALQKYMKNNFRHTSARFYDYRTIMAMLSSSRDIIEKNLGRRLSSRIASFRWGNWALDSAAVKALQDTGFRIDSSAVPGMKGHLKEHRQYDWSKALMRYPWKLNSADYQQPGTSASGILEIPIATFTLFGITLRADPVNSHLLLNAFDYYYKYADRSRMPFVFVVMTHSCEAIYEDGTPTKALKTLDEFLRYARSYKDVKFVTLRECLRCCSS
jgi:peptidoglycan/xylan/chitin deacetylase (PgdA/CDA1 family)